MAAKNFEKNFQRQLSVYQKKPQQAPNDDNWGSTMLDKYLMQKYTNNHITPQVVVINTEED